MFVMNINDKISMKNVWYEEYQRKNISEKYQWKNKYQWKMLWWINNKISMKNVWYQKYQWPNINKKWKKLYDFKWYFDFEKSFNFLQISYKF